MSSLKNKNEIQRDTASFRSDGKLHEFNTSSEIFDREVRRSSAALAGIGLAVFNFIPMAQMGNSLPSFRVNTTSAPATGFKITTDHPKLKPSSDKQAEGYIQATVHPEDVYIRQQEALYLIGKAQLLARYEGQYVAFENGQVLDHAADFPTLMRRIYPRREGRPTLVKRVEREEPVIPLTFGA